jgi:hypothetical protein
VRARQDSPSGGECEGRLGALVAEVEPESIVALTPAAGATAAPCVSLGPTHLSRDRDGPGTRLRAGEICELLIGELAAEVSRAASG